jgi:hypothetical protein
LIEQLRDTLAHVQRLAGTEFSGIGVIICDSPKSLPICPLRPISTLSTTDEDLISLLVTISSVHSEYHDGFHIISSNWKLIKVAQYFSPPILASAQIDRTKRLGGRYLAALFGSALSGVKVSGIASNGFGLAVFQDGKEVHYESDA